MKKDDYVKFRTSEGEKLDLKQMATKLHKKKIIKKPTVTAYLKYLHESLKKKEQQGELF